MNKLIGMLMLLSVIGAEVYGMARWLSPDHSTNTAEAALGALAQGDHR